MDTLGVVILRNGNMAVELDQDPDHVQPPGEPAALSSASGRIVSVDTLRGLTILLMIFVNDLGPAAPSWMHHIQPPNADGMTLADVVFPAFLFIVGVSIPLALEPWSLAGTRRWRQIGHILSRTAGLLMMGLIQLNGERDRTLGGPVWELLAFTSLICAWCVVPQDSGMRRTLLVILKTLGFIGLVVLLAVFRGQPQPVDLAFRGHVEGWVWFRTEWWGILGLIGWAYLTVALLWLILGRRREWLMGALGILILLHLAMQHAGLFSRLESKPWLGWSMPMFKTLASGIDLINSYVGLGEATGSLAAISMAGCLLGTILRRDSDVAMPRDRLAWAMTFTIGLLIAGFVTDTFEGINKISATATWCLWSAALTCAVWMLLYLVLDISGIRGWAILVRPAGANPLLAYFLHPIVVELIGVLGLDNQLLNYKGSSDPSIAVAGSLGMAVCVCVATGLLARLGLRVRL
jgi:heparan-alpha-glucosaminide N-acetyltransferase